MDLELLSKNLKKNGFAFTHLKSKDDVVPYLQSVMKKGATTAVGGSVTLSQTKVLDFLRNGDYKFFDRYEEGLSKEEIGEIFRKSFTVDYYFASSNALIMDGSIYNVDGNGNRIGAIGYGPSKVFLIVGQNKIVNDVHEAYSRIKSVAGPLNAKRLNVKTPCVKVGHCMDCSSPERICKQYQHIKKSSNERIEIILVEEDLGY